MDNLNTRGNYDHISLELLVSRLKEICGDQFVFTENSYLEPYARDQTINYYFPFDVLVKPGSPIEISSILKICNEFKVPVTPRGGGSGVTGGALPVAGGIVLSLERLNQIVSVNEVDRYVITETGVITKDLCAEVERNGLYFPVSPSSSSYSFVGGNVAENAGSINSCKYGTTSQYILNLEVVLPSGKIIWTGANVSKNVTGFNLNHLFCGSEGVLGIITKVVYRLLKRPDFSILFHATFQSLKSACDAVVELKRSNLSPSAVELITRNAIQITCSFLQHQPQWVADDAQAQLIIELEDDTESGLNDSMDKTMGLLEQFTNADIYVAYTATEKDKCWKLRTSIGAALTSNNKNYRDIDSTVPVSILYNYISKIEEIADYHQVKVACFGHALDGNLHTMLMVTNDDPLNRQIQNAAKEIYQFAIDNGGVISGEHGIGYLQREFIGLQFSEDHLALLKNIKDLFDPNGILNPRKIF